MPDTPSHGVAHGQAMHVTPQSPTPQRGRGNAVVRRWVLARDNGAGTAQEGSAWRSFGGLGLWFLRLAFDVPGTLTGFRRWLLTVAPVAPGVRAKVQIAADRSATGELAAGEKKREALIRLYELCGQAGDPRYGDRAKAAELAGEIADRIGYHPGTARRELAKYLATQAITGAQEATDTEAVA
jgi:hypothetical protein